MMSLSFLKRYLTHMETIQSGPLFVFGVHWCSIATGKGLYYGSRVLSYRQNSWRVLAVEGRYMFIIVLYGLILATWWLTIFLPRQKKSWRLPAVPLSLLVDILVSSILVLVSRFQKTWPVNSNLCEIFSRHTYVSIWDSYTNVTNLTVHVGRPPSSLMTISHQPFTAEWEKGKEKT